MAEKIKEIYKYQKWPGIKGFLTYFWTGGPDQEQDKEKETEEVSEENEENEEEKEDEAGEQTDAEEKPEYTADGTLKNLQNKDSDQCLKKIFKF